MYCSVTESSGVPFRKPVSELLVHASLSRIDSITVISLLISIWIWTSCLWRSLYFGSHSYYLRQGEREILRGGDRNKALYCCISLHLTGQNAAGRETKHGSDSKYKLVLITFVLVEE